MKNTTRISVGSALSLFAVLFLLAACVGGKSATGTAGDVAPETAVATTADGVEVMELASVEEMEVGTPLAGQYANIIIGDFGSSEKVQTDYPKAATDCEGKIVEQLLSKASYKNVSDDGTKKFPGTTAVVDLTIVDLRITSSSARMWGGVFAGSSHMSVLLKIRNAGSTEILHEKLLSTSNNAWAASYSGGSSDENLPADFGVLVGEYLSKIIPAK
jgi:hypothetical protein